jgi:hypothetical protein
MCRLVDRSLPNFRFEVIPELFIFKALQNLKASKSCGLDNISPRLFIDSVDVIVKPLTKIINASLAQGTVPFDWKTVRITPLHKKGDTTDMDNYRPISVLSVASKLLERAVHHQLYRY